MRLWAMPTTRNTTFPHSNFLAITAPVPLVVPLPACDASWLYYALNGNNTIIGNCGVALLDLALRICATGSWCEHVVDRNSTFRWRSINQEARFGFVSGQGYHVNDTDPVDNFYAFYARTEMAATLLQTITAKRIRFDRSVLTPKGAIVPAIFNGSSIALPNYALPSSPAPPMLNDTVAIVIVAAVHLIAGAVLAWLFFALYRLPRQARAGDDEDEDRGMELPVVRAMARPPDAEREEEEALPWYSAMATPPVLEEEHGVSKGEVVEEVLGQKENKAVMYI
ncbi:hypothetical protein HDU96_004893 [Phlyctochytrium bullatum]|nr:hypothetical protein HDU96_004893 [Phlyctochytrium bullatum]